MNATTDKRSADDLERRGEQIRADLDRTLDEIGRRFSSGELVDRSVDFVRDRGPELLREAGESLRRNPGPVLLTAAGLIWWAGSALRSRSERRWFAGDYKPVRVIRRRTRYARSRLDRAMHEQPFTLGALALAAGALIGAVLPMSRYENKWVGPVHDEAIARAKQASRREYDDLRQAVAASLERRANELRGSAPVHH
ncbi:DUF3618 domain-containing protein [Peristeroidobacter soli]|jgi:ElaB/YqjD/DUF883 family membrane-anchored ribosome-binding protein|uniref:DUF3618 domain-containing protein n=1 Tax=Peristeroidobacter soli TaxID=2497877 RepID=UPI001300920D|nr:DUF3618 domain-containing protein [Peristeroidobacter soli]